MTRDGAASLLRSRLDSLLAASALGAADGRISGRGAELVAGEAAGGGGGGGGGGGAPGAIGIGPAAIPPAAPSAGAPKPPLLPARIGAAFFFIDSLRGAAVLLVTNSFTVTVSSASIAFCTQRDGGGVTGVCSAMPLRPSSSIPVAPTVMMSESARRSMRKRA